MKPKVIAYSKGLTVIPYENVKACTEDPGSTGQLVVLVDHPVADASCTFIAPGEAQSFVDGFNTYLAAVEGLTLSAQFVPAEGNGET